MLNYIDWLRISSIDSFCCRAILVRWTGICQHLHSPSKRILQVRLNNSWSITPMECTKRQATNCSLIVVMDTLSNVQSVSRFYRLEIGSFKLRTFSAKFLENRPGIVSCETILKSGTRVLPSDPFTTKNTEALPMNRKTNERKWDFHADRNGLPRIGFQSITWIAHSFD